MADLQQISLDTNWQYHFAIQSEDYSSVIADNATWDSMSFTEFPLLDISPSGILWLRKQFDLNPTETCVRYFLQCDAIAYPMTIYLRGQMIAQYDDNVGLDIDITDYVSLDDNLLVLAMHLDGHTNDIQQAELVLQPIYCDDLG